MPAVRQEKKERTNQLSGFDRKPSRDRWRACGFESIELIRGLQVTEEYPRHWHDEIYLCATLGGISYLDCRGASLHVPPGSLAVVAPGDVHANRKVGCTFRCILMDSRALQDAAERFLERSILGLGFRSGLIEDPRTLVSFLRVHHALEEDQPSLARDSAAFSFVHQLTLRHGAPGLPLPRECNEDCAVRRTRRFLDEHYDQRISLHELAGLMRLSAYHLNRSFCRKIGMPPHEYQMQVRIIKAKSFLRLGRSISETASLVGFVDQSHFTRHFKRAVGVTPGQFLK